MKTLNIDSPVAQRLAQIALFERLQSVLNLEVGSIVKAIKNYEPQNPERRLEMAARLRCEAPEILSNVFAVVVALTSHARFSEHDHQVCKDQFASSVCEYFKWHAADFAEALKEKAEEEGFSAAEAARYMQGVCPEIAAQAFDRAIKILERDKK